MFIPLLLAGLVLVVAGGSWFPGAATVGWILLIACAVTFVVAVIATYRAQAEVRKRFRR